MKIAIPTLSFLVLLVTAACRPSASQPAPTPVPTHPIDAYMLPLFEAQGVAPIEGTDTELCRRLYADLLGRYPTADEVDTDCAGRDIDALVADFQSRPEYLLTSERFWQDRFRTDDIGIDWRYLKTLFARVRALHAEEIAYDDFAVESLMDPGFMLQGLGPVGRTQRAFATFFGRPPSAAESNEISRIFRPWIRLEVPDPDFPYIDRRAAFIDPAQCNAIADCSTSLLGGVSLSLPSAPEGGFAYESLPAGVADELRKPGEAFVAQPYFWEAAADAILNRYLSWSDGGLFPREPGKVLPEVRQIVTDHLIETGSYVEAERLVLTSILYRHASILPPDGYGEDPSAPEPPVWTSGPVKPVRAEAFLDTIRAFSAELDGTCDPRYSDGFTSQRLADAFAAAGGDITLAQAIADQQTLHALQEHRGLLTSGEGIPRPDMRYANIARQIGGCPGRSATRFDPDSVGLPYALAHDVVVEQICDEAVTRGVLVGSGTSLTDVLSHQMRLLYSRDATADDIADFTSAFAACTGAECTTDGLARGVCVSLLGDAEMIYP